MKYTLWCLVFGQDTVFSVKVDETQTVDELKDAIKKKNKPKFNDIAAPELKLYKLTFDENQSELEDMEEGRFDLNKKQPLHPMDELTGIFSDTVNIKLVHVLVVRLRSKSIDP